MIDISPSVIVRQLRIKGVTRNYDIEFNEGVNVIWGDMDSGKSSILGLIAYALGASSFDSYDEILEKGREVQLSVELNEKLYFFQRSLLSVTQFIFCHQGSINDLIMPKVLGASIGDDAPDGYVAFYVLDLLGLPRTQVKKSPSKTDSTLDRVGFKDVLKFLYLKQKDIAADTLLNISDPVRYIKNKQVLRYLLDVYNEKVSEIEAEIASHVKDLKDQILERDSIMAFLKKVEIDLTVDYEVELAEKLANALEIDSEIIAIKDKHRKALSLDEAIKLGIENASKRLELVKLNKRKKYDELTSYLKLKNTYGKEISSIETSLQLKDTFNGVYGRGEIVKCVVCDSLLDVDSSADPLHSLSHELVVLKHRLQGLKNFISQTELVADQLSQEETDLTRHLQNAVESYDSTYATEVSASIAVIQHLEKEKSEIVEMRKVMERNIRVIHNFDDLGEKIDLLKQAIERIKLRLTSARDNQIDSKEVVDRLRKLFAQFMQNSGLQNMTGININEQFDYFVRNRPYTGLTSGGLRTIASIGIFLSKLLYSILYPCNFPTFMMLDTPGQNIGRNRDKSEDSEVADPAIYENIYKRLLDIADIAEQKNVKCQIIVVDNDIPPFVIDNPKFFISKRFSKSEPGFDKGLISDY